MSETVSFRILDDVGVTDKFARDTSRPVMLVGFQDQENLGLGYLAATLRLHGYQVKVFDIGQDPAQILEAAKAHDPVLIGFSLIFQFYVDRFRSLMCYLRDNGVSCHFTMGGHFPSLSYQHTLELLPELDSVVRFEGEITLIELADSLVSGRDWRGLKGIAYLQAGETIATPLRALIHDLDELPFPDRSFAPNKVLGRLSTPILASRGCARTCSFCSIHMFYRAAPGKVVRTRKPEHVVREMRMLHEERGVTIFLFQDDDFPLFGPVWRRWARAFVEELHRNRLPGRVIWKINCRADAVDPDLMAEMRDAGLFLVYMGLESGSEEGLKTLHKQITVEQNLRAVRIMKELGLRFEYGFMLFDPSTTFESVRENLQFLRMIVGDGSAAASFCRMLPYDGTPIKDQLAREGRLRGDICHPDYDFLDPRVGHFFHKLNGLVHVSGWIHGIQALTPQLNYAWNELAVLERLFPLLPGLQEYKGALRKVTQDTNELLFRVVEDTSYVFTDGKPDIWTGEELRATCQDFLERLVGQRNAFIYSTQDILERALQQDTATEVAYA